MKKSRITIFLQSTLELSKRAAMVSVQEIFTMHSLFNQTLSAIVAGGLPLHVVENQDGYVIQARVPGVAKKDIQVDIQGRYLKIVVQPAQEQPAADGNRVVLSEFDTVGRAERVLQFREGLDADSASLALADGVLTIRVASPVQRNRRTLTLSD